ncbi:MAG: hypothetical protein ACW99Q_13615 [Candidatus Kariarchaeaceae archaeon]|jgi:hypothetical protein
MSDKMTEPVTEPEMEPETEHAENPRTVQKKERVGILFFQTFNLFGMLLSWGALAAVVFLFWLLFFG